MSLLSFLSNVTIEEVAPVVSVRKGGPRKDRNPKEGLKLRVFRDGSIYPSQELVDKFNLEYAGKSVEYGYGFDVIDTTLYPKFKLPEGVRAVLVNPVKKSEAKVDLFGTVGYVAKDKEGNYADGLTEADEGKPLSSVMEQGSKTFGADELIPLLEATYGVKFYKPEVKAKEATETKPAIEASAEVEGVEFVDLEFIANPVTGEPWTVPTGVAYIPKTVSRGANKGEVTVQRRENPQFYVLNVVEAQADTNEAAAEENNSASPFEQTAQ